MRAHKDLTWVHEVVSFFVYFPVGVVLAGFSFGYFSIREYLIIFVAAPLAIAFLCYLLSLTRFEVPMVSNNFMLHMQGLFGMFAFGSICVGFINFL